MNSADHSLAVDSKSQWRARATLIAIAIIFFAPVVAAILLNVYAPHWQPFGYTNKGELISPAIKTQAGALISQDGQSSKIANWLNGHWTLVYMNSGACSATCENALYRMQQVRLALGKDRHRIQRLLIGTNSEAHDDRRRRQLLLQFPGLRVVAIIPSSHFKWAPSVGVGDIVVMDPRAFIIMRFPAELSSSEILKDMQHLLKLAKKGNEPASRE